MSGRKASLIGPLLVALIFPVIGISIAAVVAVNKIPALLTEVDRGLVPEGFEAALPEEGQYTVWLHASGRVGNRLYRGSSSLPPGGTVFLFDAASGRQIELKKTVSAEKNLGEDRATSLGVFESDRAGQLIEVKGSGLNAPVLVSISRTSSGQIMRVVLLIATLILGSIFIAAMVFVMMSKRSRAGESVANHS